MTPSSGVSAQAVHSIVVVWTLSLQLGKEGRGGGTGGREGRGGRTGGGEGREGRTGGGEGRAGRTGCDSNILLR